LVKSILVVDNDTDLLFCYSLMLENDNTEVITSNDVDEAQEIVRNQKIDMVILDYMMPKLRGDQLAIKLYEIYNKIKIIFVSGYAEVVEAVKKLDIEIHGVYLKPVNPEIIEKIVASDMDSEHDPYTDDIPALKVYSNI
jgi:DNA-binding NtrC family response regulator